MRSARRLVAATFRPASHIWRRVAAPISESPPITRNMRPPSTAVRQLARLNFALVNDVAPQYRLIIGR
jgi:hypothetical protein